MNKNIRQKFIISAALMIAATASVFAQGNGLAGINEATSMVSFVFRPRHEINLRHRRGGRSYRRRESLWQVLVRRPRHEQDSRLNGSGLVSS